jgi:hypothetical protein
MLTADTLVDAVRLQPTARSSLDVLRPIRSISKSDSETLSWPSGMSERDRSSPVQAVNATYWTMCLRYRQWLRDARVGTLSAHNAGVCESGVHGRHLD